MIICGGAHMKGDKKKYTCCICSKKFTGFGNNPRPLKADGRCCDECNKKVIEARIREAIKNW